MKKNNFLESLVECAEQRGFRVDVAFRTTAVPKVIHLGPAGNYLTTITTSGATDGGKPKPLRFKVPSDPITATRSGTSNRPYFLADTPEYVLGVHRSRLSEERHSAFRRMIQDAFAVTKDGALAAILKFYEDPAQVQKCINDLGDDAEGVCCFEMNGKRVAERPALVSYWTGQVSQRSQEFAKTQTAECIVCGVVGPYAVKHRKIKGFPENPIGVPLFSNNQDAFRSYGQSGGDENGNGMANATICQSCNESYSRVLESLLQGNHDGDVSYDPQRIKLGETGVAVYWCTGVQNPVCRILLYGDDHDQIDDLLSCVNEGGKYDGKTLQDYEDEDFYLLAFGCQTGRVSIRSHFRTTMADFHRNLGSFFRESMIPGDRKYVGLNQMIDSIRIKDRKVPVESALVEDLLLAVVLGAPFPGALLDTVVLRSLVEGPRSVRSGRAALLRLCIIREMKRRLLLGSGAQDLLRAVESEVTMSLNRTLRNNSYLLGRLLSVAERAHRVKVREANVTVADRYAAALSSNPREVIGDFFAKLKLYVGDRQCPAFIKKEAAQIFSIIDPDAENIFPHANSALDQGFFYLGFFQQNVALWETWEAQKESKEPFEVPAEVDEEVLEEV